MQKCGCTGISCATASQVTMWCGIIALHQEDGIGKDRLNKLTQGIMEAENAAALQIVELGMAEASRRPRGRSKRRCSTRWPAATAKSRFARCSPKRKCSAVAGRYRNKFSEV